MKVLITGRSGSGKSTVCGELQRRGLSAFDADLVPGLSGWVDADTHEQVEIDIHQPVDSRTTLWYWDKTVLRRFLAKHGDLFLCGSADNDRDTFSLFDRVFVLTLPPEVQRQRILKRTEHDYGKLPVMQERILAEQRQFVQDALAVGATAIDAGPEPSVIVNEILRRTRER